MTDFQPNTNGNKAKWHNWQIIKPMIVEVSKTTGVDSVTLIKIAAHESGRYFNPQNKGKGTVYGIGQFTDDTWHESMRAHSNKHGIENYESLTAEEKQNYRNDPKWQLIMLAERTKENQKKVHNFNIEIPNSDDLANTYLLHNAGQTGGKNFLSYIAETQMHL